MTSGTPRWALALIVHGSVMFGAPVGVAQELFSVALHHPAKLQFTLSTKSIDEIDGSEEKQPIGTNGSFDELARWNKQNQTFLRAWTHGEGRTRLAESPARVGKVFWWESIRFNQQGAIASADLISWRHAKIFDVHGDPNVTGVGTLLWGIDGFILYRAVCAGDFLPSYCQIGAELSSGCVRSDFNGVLCRSGRFGCGVRSFAGFRESVFQSVVSNEQEIGTEDRGYGQHDRRHTQNNGPVRNDLFIAFGLFITALFVGLAGFWIGLYRVQGALGIVIYGASLCAACCIALIGAVIIA